MRLVHPLGPFGAYSSPAVELVVILLLFLALFTIGHRRIERWTDAATGTGDRQARAVLRTALLVSVGLSALCAWFILRCFPNSADEYGYIFLADTLRAGRFWNDTHPLQEFFSLTHVGEREGRWVSRFLPGWSLGLALARTIGFPVCLLNPLLGGAGLWVFHALARSLRGPRVAWIATVVMASSGYFVFSNASLRSHSLTLLLLLGFVLALVRLADRSSAGYGWIAGACLGLALITRHYTTVIVVLPVLIWFAVSQGRRALPKLARVALGAAPAIVFLLFYNLRTTGNPLALVTTWIDVEEGLGFVKGHTPLQAVEHAVRRLGMFLEWTAPTLLPVFAWALLRRGQGSLWDRRSPMPYLALTFPLLVVGHMFYFAFGGTQYGPRFYYEAYPFVVLIAVDFAFGERIPHTSRSARLARAALVAGVVFAVTSITFEADRLYRVVSERMDLYTQVELSGTNGAIVLVGAPTGELWPMPIGDLLRNGVDFTGDVLYARDLGERTTTLMRAFPERTILRYVRQPGHATGSLKLVREPERGADHEGTAGEKLP